MSKALVRGFSQRLKVTGLGSEVIDQRVKDRGRMEFVRGWRSEVLVRGWTSEVGGQRLQVRGWRSEVIGERLENRGLRIEVKGL